MSDALPGGARWLRRATAAVARHPDLWATAVRQLGVLAVDGWWRRPPHLPLPDPAYLRFRFQTMYGDPDHEPDPGDVVTYLRWCRAWPRVTDHGRDGRSNLLPGPTERR